MHFRAVRSIDVRRVADPYDRHQSTPWIPAGLGIWLAVAITAAASGAVAGAQVPPPAIAATLTGALLLTFWLSSTVRSRVARIGSATLIGLHVSRLFVGWYFLVLSRRDTLPAEFAVPAGWGDIAVGVGALAVLSFCLPAVGHRRRALMLWNTLGLLDIVLVLANGVRLLMTDAALGVAFAELPLALLPTFLVPLIITSHVLLFVRHWRAERRVGDAIVR
jgi:hypothetical protein